MARIKPMEGMNVLVGGGMEKADWTSDANGLVVPGDQKSTFFYVQMDYRLKALKLIGGAQYNKLDKIDGNTSPRLGLIYDFTPEWGGKLLYSTAFRKGYPNETGFQHWIFRGNPDLKPELINTLEAQVFYQTKRAQASMTVFQSKMKDIIGRIQVPASNPAGFQFKYINSGEWESKGVELEGRVSATPRLLVTGSAAYQTNEKLAMADQPAIKDAALHPNLMIKVGALYTGSDWSVGLFDAYFGKPKETTLVNNKSKVVNKEAEAYHLISLKGTWKALQVGRFGLNLALEVDNLAGTDIRYPDYPNKVVNTLIPLSAGRTFLFTATMLF